MCLTPVDGVNCSGGARNASSGVDVRGPKNVHVHHPLYESPHPEIVIGAENLLRVLVLQPSDVVAGRFVVMQIDDFGEMIEIAGSRRHSLQRRALLHGSAERMWTPTTLALRTARRDLDDGGRRQRR